MRRWWSSFHLMEDVTLPVGWPESQQAQLISLRARTLRDGLDCARAMRARNNKLQMVLLLDSSGPRCP